MNTYKFIVRGVLQATFYSKAIVKHSKDYKGYVRDLENGDVEVVVNLEENQFEYYKENIIKRGSIYCIIEDIKYKKIDFQKFENFIYKK